MGKLQEASIFRFDITGTLKEKLLNKMGSKVAPDFLARCLYCIALLIISYAFLSYLLPFLQLHSDLPSLSNPLNSQFLIHKNLKYCCHILFLLLPPAHPLSSTKQNFCCSAVLGFEACSWAMVDLLGLTQLEKLDFPFPRS